MIESKKQRTWYALAALAVLLISAAAYLPKVTGLGFYRDDWYLLYGGNTYGTERFYEIFASDRPFRGFLMSGAFTLFGNQILIYNLVDYALRAAGAVGVLWLVQMIWPKQKMAAALIAVLFAVYPGFTNMPNALDFQVHVLSMTAMIFSIALSVRALSVSNRIGKILLTVAAMALALFCVFGMEYYIGLEGLRLLLIWYMTEPRGWQGAAKKFGKRLVRFLASWWPYVISSGTFLVWRLFLFENERYSTNIDGMFANYLESPLLRLSHTFSDLVQGVVNITFLAWSVPFNQLTSSLRLRDWTYALVWGGIAAAVLVGFFLLTSRRKSDQDANQAEDNSWARDAVIIGVLAAAITMLPIIFGEREASLPSRFTLPGAVGGCLALVGLLYWMTSRPVWRYVVTTGLVILAVMTHYGNSMKFLYDWEAAQSVWWQLSWRAPQIEPGTVLVGQFSGLNIPEDYVLWGPANLIYYPEPVEGAIPLSAEVLTKTTQEMIIGSLSTDRVLRSIPLEKDFTNPLVLSKPTQDSCLHVLDGENLALSPSVNERVARVALYSQIDRIMTDAEPQVPPVDIFGAEPEHDWCYYYQKVSLAVQQEDWDEAVRLGDEARDQWLSPMDWVEWMPFVQAYAFMGDYETVDALAPVIKDNAYVELQACHLFSALADSVPDSYQEGQQYLVDTFCE